MVEKENEYGKIILYQGEDGNLQLDVKLYEDTVWLTRQQMADLFGRDVKTIGKHISNALREELDSSTVANFATVQNEGGRIVNRQIEYYNLDMIISIGYRVKSKRGIEFRRWANDVLKKYLLDGYVINQCRLDALNKTVEIQSKIIAGLAEIDADDVLRVVKEYENSFSLLDEYDHQNVEKPLLHTSQYVLQIEECRKFIKGMEFYSRTGLFGTEKEEGKLEGILAAINQTAFGTEVYPSLEEKAANLLYFLIKDHPFNDGCKRIAAGLFLYFLDKNKALRNRNGLMILSKSALVATTLMVAESRAEEKDIIVKVVMNLLHDCGGRQV